MIGVLPPAPVGFVTNSKLTELINRHCAVSGVSYNYDEPNESSLMSASGILTTPTGFSSLPTNHTESTTNELAYMVNDEIGGLVTNSSSSSGSTIIIPPPTVSWTELVGVATSHHLTTISSSLYSETNLGNKRLATVGVGTNSNSPLPTDSRVLAEGVISANLPLDQVPHKVIITI